MFKLCLAVLCIWVFCYVKYYEGRCNISALTWGLIAQKNCTFYSNWKHRVTKFRRQIFSSEKCWKMKTEMKKDEEKGSIEDNNRMERGWGRKVSFQQPEAIDSSLLTSPWRRVCTCICVCECVCGCECVCEFEAVIQNCDSSQVWKWLESIGLQETHKHTYLPLYDLGKNTHTQTHTVHLLLHMPHWLYL